MILNDSFRRWARPLSEWAGEPAPPAPRSILKDPGSLILVGTFLLATLVVLGHELEPALTFRPVDAVVVGADVARMKTYSGRGRSYTHYQSEVFYRYEVHGVRYMGNLYMRTHLTTFVDATNEIQALPADGKVRAWYNPLKPSEAVLSRAPNVFLICLMLVFTFVPATIVELQLRSRARAAPPRPANAPIE